MEALSAMLPEGISWPVAWVLVVCSSLTSLLTAALGAGGGVMLLAIMAVVMPPLAIVPVHGVVQLGSNVNRAVMTYRHIDWPVIFVFIPGVVAGASLAAVFLVQLPPHLLQLSIAAFVLYLCWGPKLPKLALEKRGIFFAAIITSFIGMFVGASGPLVAAFIKQLHSERFRTVATFAMAMTVQHAPKILVFGAVGFVFSNWLPLMLAMILSGALGTWLGLKLLRHVSNHQFDRLFTMVLSLLALRLIWQAWQAM